MAKAPRKTALLATKCSPAFYRRVEKERVALGQRAIGHTVFYLIAKGLGIPAEEIAQLMRRAPRSRPSNPGRGGGK